LLKVLARNILRPQGQSDADFLKAQGTRCSYPSLSLCFSPSLFPRLLSRFARFACAHSIYIRLQEQHGPARRLGNRRGVYVTDAGNNCSVCSMFLWWRGSFIETTDFAIFWQFSFLDCGVPLYSRFVSATRLCCRQIRLEAVRLPRSTARMPGLGTWLHCLYISLYLLLLFLSPVSSEVFDGSCLSPLA
jgi:hypothetical protein